MVIMNGASPGQQSIQMSYALQQQQPQQSQVPAGYAMAMAQGMPQFVQASPAGQTAIIQTPNGPAQVLIPSQNQMISPTTQEQLLAAQQQQQQIQQQMLMAAAVQQQQNNQLVQVMMANGQVVTTTMSNVQNLMNGGIQQMPMSQNMSGVQAVQYGPNGQYQVVQAPQVIQTVAAPTQYVQNASGQVFAVTHTAPSVPLASVGYGSVGATQVVQAVNPATGQTQLIQITLPQNVPQQMPPGSIQVIQGSQQQQMIATQQPSMQQQLVRTQKSITSIRHQKQPQITASDATRRHVQQIIQQQAAQIFQQKQLSQQQVMISKSTGSILTSGQHNNHQTIITRGLSTISESVPKSPLKLNSGAGSPQIVSSTTPSNGTNSVVARGPVVTNPVVPQVSSPTKSKAIVQIPSCESSKTCDSQTDTTSVPESEEAPNVTRDEISLETEDKESNEDERNQEVVSSRASNSCSPSRMEPESTTMLASKFCDQTNWHDC